jgi:hypothetical protein
VVEQTDFKSMLGLAGRSLEEQGLPSAVALLTAVGALSVSEIRDAISGELRPTDVPVEVGDKSLAVLLPLEAGRDAEATAGRYLASVEEAGGEASVKLWTMGEAIEAEGMWEEIVTAVGT